MSIIYKKKQSRWRDLNSRPLPYQGSALPLSYTGVVLSGRRGSNPRPLAWKANALPTELLPQFLFLFGDFCVGLRIVGRSLPLGNSLSPHSSALNSLKNKLRMISCGRRWIRTTEGINQQIYSLPHLATLVFSRFLVSFW